MFLGRVVVLFGGVLVAFVGGGLAWSGILINGWYKYSTEPSNHHPTTRARKINKRKKQGLETLPGTRNINQKRKCYRTRKKGLLRQRKGPNSKPEKRDQTALWWFNGNNSEED